MRPVSVAIVGATGAVGREMLDILETRPWKIRELRLFASKRSVGRKLRFRGKPHVVDVLGPSSFKGCDVALFDAATSVSKEWVPQAIREDAVVDNSSAYRMDPKVPLVVPEVNGNKLSSRQRLLAGPNCVAVPLVIPWRRSIGLRD